jgi:WD40 repeat protein
MSTDGRLMAWGDEDGTVTIWDYRAGRPLHVDSYSPARVWSVAFSPDGKTLASANVQSDITLWDVDSGERIVSFRTINQVLSVSWSPDSKRIAAAVGPHVIVWDVAGKTRITQEDIVFDENLGFVVREVAWSPDGDMIAAACENNIVYLLEPETGDIARQYSGHQNKVKSVAWAPNSALLASGGDDRKILLWDISRTAPIAELLGHSDNVVSLAFSFDGSLLASGGDIADKSISFWDMQTLSLIDSREDNTLSVESLAFVPRAGDVLLASGSRDGEVGLYEVITEQPLNQSLSMSEGEVIATGIDPDGGLLLARYRSGQSNLVVTRFVEGEEEEVRSGLSNFRGVVSAAFGPNGGSLAYSTDAGEITIADVESGAEIATFTNAPGVAYALALNDRYLASSHCAAPSEDSETCQQNEIWLWDLTTGSPDGEPMTGHGDTITALAFSPDSSVLASGSRDKTIIHWELDTREPEGLPLSRHLGGVTSLAFSPDGKLQASGSSDQTIILWDVAADQPIGRPLRGFTADVLSLVFTSDGVSLYSGTRDGETLIWDTDIESWIERACRLAGRSLDQSEWIEFFPGRPYDPICGEATQATPTPTSTPSP